MSTVNIPGVDLARPHLSSLRILVSITVPIVVAAYKCECGHNPCENLVKLKTLYQFLAASDNRTPGPGGLAETVIMVSGDPR